MTVELLAQWMKQSKTTVVLTGAGMSTESGIPDFRSQSGWWQNIDPRTVATTDSLQKNYAMFREFYQMRIQALKKCAPHKGHHILADLEKRGLISLIATQNVDQLHQQAGSKKVAELHGNIMTARCQKCNKPHVKEQFLNNAICTYCSDKLRPNVVLFGETLPMEAWNRSLNEIQNADLVIVIGTSLEVYPVNQLPQMAKGRLVYINLDQSSDSGQFDLVLEGTAGDILAELDEALEGYSKG
ncbi:NAD-dependent deacylase [Solibacillus sp. FSL W8-0372]|uniref:SIR2 family NAD-dependent protein deacylase n=1 Tax=Solibacillus sp. FSL W8-0372 TaxID=2921713 RepID=UPI0030D58C58